MYIQNNTKVEYVNQYLGKSPYYSQFIYDNQYIIEVSDDKIKTQTIFYIAGKHDGIFEIVK